MFYGRDEPQGSTTEMVRSLATRRAIRHFPHLVGVGFCVLAYHHSQQAHRVGLFPVKNNPSDSLQDCQTVTHQPVDQPRTALGITPITPRLTGLFIIMGNHHLPRLGNQTTTPTNLGGDHGHRVLGNHRVVQHRGVQHPTATTPQHSRLRNHRPHRVEHPLRSAAPAQPRPPQRQHRWMEPLIGQR